MARGHANRVGRIKCPCRKCTNRYCHHINAVETHLIVNIFDLNYTEWIIHGEEDPFFKHVQAEHNDDNSQVEDIDDVGEIEHYLVIQGEGIIDIDHKHEVEFKNWFKNRICGSNATNVMLKILVVVRLEGINKKKLNSKFDTSILGSVKKKNLNSKSDTSTLGSVKVMLKVPVVVLLEGTNKQELNSKSDTSTLGSVKVHIFPGCVKLSSVAYLHEEYVGHLICQYAKLPNHRQKRASWLMSKLGKRNFAKSLLLFATMLGTSMIVLAKPCMWCICSSITSSYID
ncbi:hypothetical protein CFP56_013009 [Quercus suber]|uniref:Transposase-associated domain-containing protein n=1 Tax=Quercus suber TaxID=58331 RepID=A0AAW0M6C0_QUESU